jgi:hypothetical protein
LRAETVLATNLSSLSLQFKHAFGTTVTDIPYSLSLLPLPLPPLSSHTPHLSFDVNKNISQNLMWQLEHQNTPLGACYQRSVCYPNALTFINDYSRFSFYEFDLGSGKPFWYGIISIITIQEINSVDIHRNFAHTN